MNSPKAQSDSSPTASYFDPDAADGSEQQFSASLEAPAERPQFVVDALETTLMEQPSAIWEQPSRFSPTLKPSVELRSTGTAEGGCPHTSRDSPVANSDDVPNAGPAATAQDGQSAGATVEQAAKGTRLAKPADPGMQPDWRDLVSAKVSSYKSRRPRTDRYPSLQLPFESASFRSQRPAEQPDNVASSGSQSVAAEISALQPRNREPAALVVLEATARILEFPRSAAIGRGDELADPVIDRPRIVEAPELLPPPPALGGILIEPIDEPEPERLPGFDLPLQSTPLSQRILAGGIDALMVAVALAAFGYTFFRISSAAPQGRSTLGELIAALLVIFWPAYQYAFLVFTGTTPGLRVAKLQVSRFDGTLAPRNLRRWRVLASLLSCISLGLGYAWCFLDEDRLSWHDRITKTHLAPKLER